MQNNLAAPDADPLSGARSVPFLNLKALTAEQEEDYIEVFKTILSNAAFVSGKELEAFEKEFAAWVGPDRFVAGCGNGTDAIALSARALGLGPGDEAILPAMTFFATAEALCAEGLQIKLVDVQEGSWLMDIEQLRAAVSKKTKLIVPVHLYGQMAEMDAIRKIADSVSAYVLEDSAQAHGATWRGKGAGHWGDVASYSFYPSKNLGAFGDGGAVLSRDKNLISRVRAFANHGSVRKYEHLEVGCNSRLDNLQAALLRVKLRHVSQWNKKRRGIATSYREHLSNIPGLNLPREVPGAEQVYHLFVVTVDDRVRFQSYLEQRGICTGVHYPQALHQIPPLAKDLRLSGHFPCAEKVAAQGVSLPMCPTLGKEEVQYVSQVIRSYFGVKG